MLTETPLLQFARFNERCEPRAINRLHSHPNWQVELIMTGTPTVHTDTGRTSLGPGDTVILPPYVLHEFTYDTKPTAWYTIRFSHEAMDAATHTIISLESGQPFFALLSNILEVTPRQLDDVTQRVIEHGLAALLAYNYQSTSNGLATGSLFLQKIHDYLSQNCNRAISVDELAQCVGYSPSHTRALYKQKTGASLKQAIDQARFNEAFQYLLHSDYSISEIGHELGFPDVFTFSRFIRRMGKTSPKELRKASVIKAT